MSALVSLAVGILPVVLADKMHADIPGSELAIFDKAGHLPQFEKAAEFNKRVLEFLTAGK